MPAFSKKTILSVILITVVALLAGLGYFVVVRKHQVAAENGSSQNVESTHLKSFRGVLADILTDVKGKTAAIEETITNPFSEKKVSQPAGEPAANSENVFSFAVLGDTQRFSAGNPDGNFQKIMAQITKLNPDMVIAVGDLIGSCQGKSSDAADYANWKKILGPFAAKTYAVQGNHDRVSDGSSCDKIWQDAFNFPSNGPSGFSELTYSLDLKNSHFVFLDSDKPDEHQINSAQRNWLEQDLARNKKEDIFVVFHEPAFPVSSKIDESLDTQAGERNPLWQILDKYNVTAVFNGHEHIVSRRKIDSRVFPGAKNSIYQFVFGNTDSFDHDLPKPGIAEYANQGQGRFGLVQVNGKELTIKTVSADGHELNSFTFSK